MYRHRPDQSKAGAARNIAVPPEAEISVDLEIYGRFGLRALSGKAGVISKSISRTLTFLETRLETSGHLIGTRARCRNLPPDLELCAQKAPRAAHTGAKPYLVLTSETAKAVRVEVAYRRMLSSSASPTIVRET